MKYHFIINPVAGKQDSSIDMAPAIYHAAERCGIPEKGLTIQLTQRPDHATFLARQAAQSGEPVCIYAVGGDGTFNEALRGALPYKNAAVGLLPYGSGNDFLRNFGTKEEFRDIEDQLSAEAIDIDLIRTNRGYAAAICSAGLDAKVAYGIPKFRRVPFCHGEMAYKLSIVECLLGQRNTKLQIEIDGKSFERDCIMVAICNGCSYGGGFMAAPESRLDDGVLDVMVVKNLPLLKIAKVLPLYQAGQHFKNGAIIPELQDIVEYFPAKRVKLHTIEPNKQVVVNVDGECGLSSDLSAEIEPLAARVLLPHKAFVRYKALIKQG